MARTRSGSLARLSLAAACVIGASCFEDPISEELHLDIKKDDRVALTLKVEISLPDNNQNRLLEARVRSTQERLLRGEDEWGRRFDLIAPSSETVRFQKVRGKLKTIEREAVIDAGDLPRFFFDTSLTFRMARGTDWSELIIHTGTSKRATRQQQVLLSGRLDQWCSAVSTYQSTLAGVYRYLDSHPDRAEAVLGAVLKGEMSEEDKASIPDLKEDEKKRVDELMEAMTGVTSIFVVNDDEEYSMNEISSLVYDPFPANFSVHVPGKILESEGFEEPVDQTVRVRRMTLWGAFPSMAERWITPDPLVPRLDASRSSGREKVKLPAFLAQPRRVLAVPSAAAVKAALIESLQPRPMYRVRWSERSSS